MDEKTGPQPPPKKPKNADRRGREHLTPDEVDRLRSASSKVARTGHRNATMILLAYRHGLRVGELVELRRDQVDLETGVLHVRRSKGGTPSTHPLGGEETRAIRKVLRQAPPSPYLFLSELGGPMTGSSVRKMVAAAGAAAGLGFPAHPHMLRHACGFYLANKGVDTRAIQHYLGHKNIQHTVKYTALANDRFKGFWED